MANAYVHRTCPTCHQEASPSAAQVAAKRPAESLTFEVLRDYWRGFFQEKVFFTYFRCNQCGVLFCPSFFDSTQLTNLYSNMPDNTAGVEQDTVRKTQEGYFRILKKYSDLQGQMLELGPDIGLFSEFCRKEGRFNYFWMFEPNVAVHSELKRRLEGVPTTISTELLSFVSVPDQSVDVVAMIHVLDHLLEPRKLLSELREKLRPGAKLMVVTHDESSLLTKLVRKGWPAYCLQHPQLYNPASMRNLLTESGFKVISVERTANSFPVFYLVRHLLWAIGLKKFWLPQLPWLRISLKLGNMCTIATLNN